MDNSLYHQFLKANARDIKESLELLANSEPNFEVDVPSHIVEEVVWGLGYGNGRLDFDGTVKAQKYDSFHDVYNKLKATLFWRDIEEGNNTSVSEGIEDRVGSELYNAFILRFSRPIYRTLETLNDDCNHVDGDLAIVKVLQKMGHARILPYSVNGEVGFRKTKSFDTFYQLFKQTRFYQDIQKNAGLKK